ncbi:AIP3-domain-containing protein [Testicularia cyperi]|uniref:AIP3-domain-containing protein n=1 Tax=Testicularia cyperi TaxID=1882483 RepID=A0A317XRU8_9BASI|nr:AIP3-domain-containing protein [Testicularia cyperi]
MFSNLINNRKGSNDRGSSSPSHQRQSSANGPVTADRIRHPQHVYAHEQQLAKSPPSQLHEGHVTSFPSHHMARQDSAGSSTSGPWQSPPAQLPEEMRAREKQRQMEKERERRERQSSRSSNISQSHAHASHQQPVSPAQSQVPAPAIEQPVKYSSNHMESSVTRLLVATKMLLEALTKWSLGQRSEEDVSDIYVRLGNDFNSAKLAFGSYGIDMSSLNSVPDDLRDCLERCLSEDASPAVLEVHLPRIREIIINLLQGLKMKQAEYKQFLVQQRAAKEAKRESVMLEPATPPTAASAVSRARVAGPRTSRQFVSDGGQPSHDSSSSVQQHQQQQQSSLSSDEHAQSQSQDLSFASPTGTQIGRPESLQRASSAGASLVSDRSATEVGSVSPSLSTKNSIVRPPSRVARAASDRTSNRDSGASPALQQGSLPSAHASGDEESASAQVTPRLPNIARHALVDNGPETATAAASDGEETEEISDRVAGAEAKLNGVSGQRFSGRSPRHVSRPSVDTADMSDADPSLRALKNREALERRASKRFSAYTFNKMGVGQSFSQGLGMNLGSPLTDRKTTERRGSGARRVVHPPLPGSNPSSESTSPAAVPRSGDYFSSTGGNSASTAGGAVASGAASGAGRAIPRSKSAMSTTQFESIEEVKTPTSASFGDDARTPSPDKQATVNTGAASSAAAAASSTGRGANGLLSPNPPTARVTSQAISSTDSLPFVDAQAPPSDLVDAADLAASPSVRRVGLPAGLHQLPARSRPAPSLSGVINLFLQLGRQTRKAVIELDETNVLTRGITIAKLRMLFMDRFAYSPGMDDFPTIYVKDVGSGVTYELEDLDDVQEGSLLTLNIEPLDQVKQHLDLSLGNITRELRELKAALAERERDARRMSHGFVAGNESMLAAINQTPTKISDSQFQAAGQRVAQLKRANTRAAASASFDEFGGSSGDGPSLRSAADGPIGSGSGTIASPTASSSSSGFASGSRIAHELKVQFEELQNLRREFAITRQLQGDFETDVKSILSTVREQASKVREIASTKVATERNFIVAGKSKLDTNSQDLLTLIEDLQDTVDDLKQDVIQRGVKPKPALVKQIVDDIEKANSGLLDLEQYVQTVKPSWKKTWETELQNIVDEQEFLNHEEGLMADLREDLSALKEVFSNIQQVVKLRGGSGKGGKYIPPLPEEGHEGLSTVMLEVRTQAVNHEKRLRALQAAEKQRQKDLLASKSQDEFTEELAGFVDRKVLRKTGGVLEAERVRQKRDHATWKAMFGGGGPGGVPVAPQAGGPGSGDTKPKKLILGKKSSAADPSLGTSTAQSEEDGAQSADA